MDRIDLFRIFRRVVECASFTRAADLLGLPRSTVSSAVQELETRVGVRLLHRTTRRVSATQDGLLLYERCGLLLADVEETENLFRQDSEEIHGEVHADVPGRIGRLIIVPALPEFLSRHTGVSVRLGMTDRAVNLVEDAVDCVVRVGPLGDSGLIARPIGDLPLINVASPAYLERHGTPATPARLSGHFAVNYASPSTGRVEEWEWVEDDKTHGMSLPGRITVNSAEAYIAACLAGLGLIQIPAFDVKRHIASGDLVEVMPDHRAAPMPMSLLYPHRHHLPRRVRLFADWLERLLKRELL